jgi:hypothetical protein
VRPCGSGGRSRLARCDRWVSRAATGAVAAQGSSGRLGLNARLPGSKRWPVGTLVEGSEGSTLGWLAAGSGSVQDAAMDDTGAAAGSASQARAWAALAAAGILSVDDARAREVSERSSATGASSSCAQGDAPGPITHRPLRVGAAPRWSNVFGRVDDDGRSLACDPRRVPGLLYLDRDPRGPSPQAACRCETVPVRRRWGVRA